MGSGGDVLPMAKSFEELLSLSTYLPQFFVDFFGFEA
jgi:hypothetical protein